MNICAHEHHEHLLPKRSILTPEDLGEFGKSETCAKFVGFLESLNSSVRGRKLTDNVPMSPVTERIVDILDQLELWIQEIPPAPEGKSRFGNPAFRDWFDRLEQSLHSMLEQVAPDHFIGEVSLYLLHSFGNRKRIDYGTGHEAHFMAFLFCLNELDVISEQDYAAIVLKVFWGYLRVMRSLQGSHGVWGLDDYHFLPFYFGSSQLADHKHMRPKSIHNKEIVDEFSKDYMYLACIQFINSVKTASLRWHSPMLDDISGVKTWEKVNQGMLKMYKVEVLGKLPIMQHFLFGSLLPFEGSASASGGHEDVGNDHVHAFGQVHPECCGIRVPSSIAASLSETKVKPLPFD